MLLSAFERQTPAAAGGAHAGGSGQGVAAPGDHGRLASRPSEISRRGWKDILWRVYSEANEDRILSVAAGMTFYGLLAVFPAVSAFVALYGLIKRFLDDELIVELPAEDDGNERRRPYKLTPFGRQVARAEAVRLEQMVTAARGARLLPDRG